MKLILQTNSGIQYEMEVANYHSLEDLKAGVETNLGIPISIQTLSFNGKILRHDDDLINAIILDGSRIHLHIAPTHPWPHEIFLKMPPPLRSFSVIVDVNQTIHQLKVKLQEMAAATTDPLIIVIKHQNGTELPDGATMLECQMALYPEVTVDFELPEIILFALNFTELKRVIPMRAAVNTTIEKVKEQIQEMRSGPTGIVLTDANGTELADEKTLHECRISANSEVRVKFRTKMQLLVIMPGQKLPFSVNGICFEDTIAKLKEHLRETEGLPMGRRMVIRHENGRELPDHKRLFECQISFPTAVTVEFRP